MPCESSTPLVVLGLVAAVVAGWYGLATGSRGSLVAASLAALAAVGCFVADRAVVTDREELEALFPRLAVAATNHDLETVLAAVAPELRPLREEVDKVLWQVKPTDVEVTRTAIEVAPDGTQATADVLVRLRGNVIDSGTRTTAVAAVRVSLEKRGDTWLIVAAKESRVGFGGP